MIEFELTCVLSSTRGLLGCLRVVFVNLRPVDHVVFDVDEIGKLDGMVNAIWRVPYLPQAAPPAPARRHVAAPSRRARRRCGCADKAPSATDATRSAAGTFRGSRGRRARWLLP